MSLDDLPWILSKPLSIYVPHSPAAADFPLDPRHWRVDITHCGTVDSALLEIRRVWDCMEAGGPRVCGAACAGEEHATLFMGVGRCGQRRADAGVAEVAEAEEEPDGGDAVGARAPYWDASVQLGAKTSNHRGPAGPFRPRVYVFVDVGVCSPTLLEIVRMFSDRGGECLDSHGQLHSFPHCHLICLAPSWTCPRSAPTAAPPDPDLRPRAWEPAGEGGSAAAPGPGRSASACGQCCAGPRSSVCRLRLGLINVPFTWGPGVHAFFPRCFRRIVRAFVRCVARGDRLPEDLLLDAVGFMACGTAPEESFAALSLQG